MTAGAARPGAPRRRRAAVPGIRPGAAFRAAVRRVAPALGLAAALAATAGGAKAQDDPCLVEPGPPDLETTLRAADEAVAAGDEARAVAPLLEASRSAGEWLGPQDRWLLARDAERRGDGRGAIFQYGHLLTVLMRRGVAPPEWIGERIRRLDAAEEARKARAFAAPPLSGEARAAFGEGRAAFAAARLADARTALKRALSLAPAYVEAALLLGAVETKAGRRDEAVAAMRVALGADPERVEAIVRLANLLWEEPSRSTKEESLTLLDRAAGASPDSPALLRVAAERWAEWGDPRRALERLDAWRARAGPADAATTDSFRQRLLASLRDAPVSLAEPLPEDPSPAAESARLAQVLLRRGDPLSLDTAARVLDEAARLDPRHVPTALLSAERAEVQGDAARAEAELRRAAALDAARTTAWERLARLVARDPSRGKEARALWERAEAVGSTEAVYRLAVLEGSAAYDSDRAEGLFVRYLLEAPGGPFAEDARDRLGALRSGRRSFRGVWIAGLVGLAAGFVAWLSRRGGTLAHLLARNPAAAREMRPAVGRLRHELFKHGRRLVDETRAAFSSGDAERVRFAAAQLNARLFGRPADGGTIAGTRGLLDEARAGLDEIGRVASVRGARLSVERDPELGPVAAALRRLESARGDLEAAARDGRVTSSLSVALEAGHTGFDPARGARLGRLLDAAGSVRPDAERLARFFDDEAVTLGLAVPPLDRRGALASGGSLPRVRIDAGDWATIWRNLFSNALRHGAASGSPLASAIAANRTRDVVTGEARVRFELFDSIPAPLTREVMRTRPKDRGLGVVASLVARHEGLLDVREADAPFTKAIVLELPAVEDET